MKCKHNKWRLEEEESFTAFEKRHKNKHRADALDDLRNQYKLQRERGFTCIQCGFPTTADRELSGVNNRNDCPRCLYSRHVDELKAGDRKAECRSRMKPVGLTLKHITKRYGQQSGGELMLIHHCTGCGKISINRIAADDDASVIYQLFDHSLEYSSEYMELLDSQGIVPLGKADLTTVYSQLFGWRGILEEFEPHEIQGDNLISIPEEADLDEKDFCINA